MKKVLMVLMAAASTMVFAQNKVDEVRMQRDIEVAENILGTLIKQQYGKRQFFPMEVQGSYLPGYGVTFHVPSEMFGNMFLMQSGDEVWNIEPMPPMPPGAVSISGTFTSGDNLARDQAESNAIIAKKQAIRSKTQANKRKAKEDSTRNSYHEKLLEAAKTFIADYGDLLTQLQPNEKIIVTNKSENANLRMTWIGALDGGQNQNLVIVEGNKADVNQFRQGKMSRNELIGKIKVVNSEISDETQPDLELMSSILNRLYSRDLSKTFFADGNIYYERLKDFGALYHMQVYASSQTDEDMFDMPTLRLQDLNQDQRDQKVKEMYPDFERSIKEDVLEYGRTIKSLKEEETLMVEVNLTRCPHCGIPSTLELSIKSAVLRDYSSGKITKETALSKMEVKKGAEQ
ncbi:MAG: hypothetical protein JSS79_02085 [Bacteroidetes bacterium]|nr:hypothetical protein [Bacteroidota bacterium]